MKTIVLLALIDAAKVLILAGILIWYRQNKRFKEDRKQGMGLWIFLDSNIVETILGVAIVPSLMNLAKLLSVG